MKLFTIMIYEDGCNELEYEIDKRYKELISLKPIYNINIVIETSKLNREIATILRPDIDFTDVDSFIGTRRYSLSNSENTIVEELGNINMADPKVLKDFVIWCGKNYPAHRYILIIGGHGFEFVGMITDYSGEKPYITGFPELSKAIVEGSIEANINIDILILDSCYGNNLETFYEFGMYKKEYIKYLITHSFWGNIKGISYKSVIDVLESNLYLDSYNIVYKLSNVLMKANDDFPIISIRLDYSILLLLKNLYSTLALVYLSSGKYIENAPLNLLVCDNEEDKCFYLSKRIRDMSKCLIIYDGDCINGGEKVLQIRVLAKKIKEREKQELYSRLSFTNNNYWLNLLCNVDCNSSIQEEEKSFEPIELQKNIIFSYISSCNYKLSAVENWDIVNFLIEYNKWDI